VFVGGIVFAVLGKEEVHERENADDAVVLLKFGTTFCCFRYGVEDEAVGG
jgi:hypothetical protein